MSEFQKWVASISGAVVGQIAVLAFFYLLISNSTSPSLSAKSSAPPGEVTVMLSQLAEQAREEELLPEEDETDVEEKKPEELPPEEIPPANQRHYINTDSTTARVDAPENARFESDRNTTESTEFLPDPDQPQTQGPTLRGDDKVKGMTLANQDYTDGKIKPDPTPPPAMNQSAATPSLQATPVEETVDTPPAESEQNADPETPADKLTEGEAQEAKPGEADTPPDRLSDQLTQPEARTIEEEAQMASTTESFMDPANAHSSIKAPAEINEEDREAIATKVTDEFDEPAAPEEKQEIKATPVNSGQSVDKIKQQQQAAAETKIQEQIDASMFADPDAYRAFRRQNIQNGNITTLGEGSVNAISTETGKYKKAVEQAVGRKWHQYRRDRADQVTFAFLRVRFIITPSGNVRDIKILKKEATELVTEFSLRAIVDADIPRMPPEVANQLGPGGLEMFYNIEIF